MEKVQHGDLFLVFENAFSSVISGSLGARYVALKRKKPILDMDSNKEIGFGMSQFFHYAEIDFDKTVSSEETFKHQELF